MTVTAVMRETVRRMCGTRVGTPFSDDALDAIIERYPIIDSDEQPPYEWDGDSWEDNDDWTPTYDLNAAAAQIWLEKASVLVGKDGYEDALKMHRRYQALRVVESMPVRPADDEDTGYIVNRLVT